ncbi:MAG: TPR domain protein, putative component of TonB system [Candidatus Ozemobacter sibiricus]|uniref:TPR domain protein, putative component of TonB system n=1 Tax=Candidatus Ozemobacter sibiricus TaxID=2268124 RepID=A0A367ZUC7_9BACT|nr:MAG: TPR domain protein, putative component of TonB system [Candidatus Ozemobacter sibiricus]
MELSGTSAAVYQIYGEILMQEGKTSEAIDAFHKAVHLDPECHLALGYAAILSLDRPLFQQAVDLLQKKIEKHPGWPDLRRDLGELYLRHDRPAEALPHLQEAIRINPRYEDARVRLAEALFQLDRGEEAIRELLAMTQKNAPAFYLLGKCFQSIDRLVEALEAFRIVQRICPTYRDTNDRIAELQDYFARLNNLISMHQKIRREHPTYLDVRLKLAQLLTSAGRRGEAETEYLEALALKPDFKPAQEGLQRLRAMPAYDLQALSGPTHEEGRTCRGIVCPGLHIALHFGDQALDPVFQERFSKFLLSFRNIRNGRTWDFKIPATFSSTIDLSATALCPMAEDDVIQVKLINPQSSEVLFADAYLLTDPGPPNCRLAIDFATTLLKLLDQLPLIVPLRAFLVGIPRVAFPCREGNPLRDLTPILVNPRNQVKAEGRIDPDHPDQYCFVLYTPNDQEDVVKLGDLLEVYYGATMDEQSLVMQIRVGPDDLVACSRFLAPEEVALPKPALNRPPPTPPLAASEPSPTPGHSGQPQPAALQAGTPAAAAQGAPPPRPPAAPSPKVPTKPTP